MLTRRLTTVLIAALLAAASVLCLADETPGQRYFATRLAKVSKLAAARIWEAAERARRDSLFRFARAQAQRVLELDADHARARALLGYVRRGDAWGIDLGASQKSPAENQETAGRSLGAAESAWRTGHLRRAEIDVAGLYASLGEECSGKGFRKEADVAFAMALELDRDNAAAHRGLGHVEFAAGFWIGEDAHRAFLASRAAKPIAEASRYDEMLGTTLTKAESGHFRVESPHGADLVAGYLESCERAYTAYLADLGVGAEPSPFPRRPLFCVTDTEAQWDRWINHQTQGNPGFWRQRSCHWARDRWACALHDQPGQTDENRRDRLAHETVHMLNLAVFGMADGSWLDDALAYRYCILVQGTTSSFCLLPKSGDYASPAADLDWLDPSQWRSMLKDTVARKDDPSLRLIVNRRSYDLPLFASVKAWSVVDFLMKRDRAAFLAMLREQKDEKDRVGLLETRFGRDVESLDDAWRLWVRETY